MFGETYITLCEQSLEAAEDETLPMNLKLEETFGLTFQDISDLFHDFINDTGLDITGDFYMCDECNKLHLNLRIDYPEDDEPLLQ